MKISNNSRVAGIGSALVDILVHAPDTFLERNNILKGGMLLVDNETIEAALASDPTLKQEIVAGGSACNTIVGIGKLGGNPRFVGKLGQDELGTFFKNGLADANVEPMLFSDPLPTGRVLSVISPDAQRSMLTYLGASAAIEPQEVTPDCFSGMAIVHVEGYLVFNRDLILAAFQAAKEAGAQISLDLASYNVVEESKAFIHEIVKDYVDILIANEDEAVAYTGVQNEQEALKQLADHAQIAVLKVGKRGSYIAAQGDVIRIDGVGRGAIVDTTGAGDLWASGFLYGLANGWSLEQCGNLGSLCGYEVCCCVGAHIPDTRWQVIREKIDSGNLS